MTAIAYIRVSTEQQTESGLGLEAQIAKVRAHAELHDLVIADVISDEGISGTDESRPGLQHILRRIEKQGDIDTVIVYSLSRITRSTKHLCELVEFFERHGVAFVSVTESIDTASAMGRFVVRLLGSLAELERDLVGERTSAALQARKARGQHVGGVPYGWKLGEDGTLVPGDEVERTVVHIIRGLRESGVPFAKIAKTLNETGYRNRYGKPFNRQTVTRILKSQENV